MTVSALSAMVLRDWLHESRRHNDLVSSRFQKILAKSNSPHWALATGQDSRFPTTRGASKPGRQSGLLHWYISKLFTRANTDPDLHTLLTETAHLLKSPLALFHPKVVLRVLSKSASTHTH